MLLKKLNAKDSAQMMEFLEKELPWVPTKSLTAVITHASKLDQNKIDSHYIFHTIKEEAMIKYCMVNVIKSQTGEYTITVSQENRRVFGAKVSNHYHDLSTSSFGLLVKDPTVIFESEYAAKKEFHKFNRIRLNSAIIAARASQKSHQLAAIPIAAVIQGAKMAVDAIASSWKSIAEAFKTVTSEEIKEKITGEGFAEYNAKSRYLRSIGIPKSFWPTYQKDYMRLTGIANNPIVKPEIETLLKMADFIADNAWNSNDFTFDMDKGGTCSNFVAMTRHDVVDQKMHIMTTVVDGTFNLAPNIWIYSKYKSIAGGILETTKLVTKRVPRAITQDDVKAVNAMMLLNSINIMQENFGIPKTLPEFKEILDASKMSTK